MPKINNQPSLVAAIALAKLNYLINLSSVRISPAIYLDFEPACKFLGNFKFEAARTQPTKAAGDTRQHKIALNQNQLVVSSISHLVDIYMYTYICIEATRANSMLVRRPGDHTEQFGILEAKLLLASRWLMELEVGNLVFLRNLLKTFSEFN